MMNSCLECQKPREKYASKYCSNRCQAEYQYKQYIAAWQQNDGKSSTTKNISRHLLRFIMEKSGERCSQCGWHQKNPSTGRVPIEIDHIDGNADNNQEGNLRLLCPNCHALTPNFRNLNKGNGRKWRNTRTDK